jgi:hypothetical protein
MIVKLTAKDNLNSFYIKHFLEAFFIHGGCLLQDTYDSNNLIKEETTYSRVMALLVGNEPLSTNEKDFVLEFVKKRFFSYLRNRNGWLSASLALDEIEIELSDTLIDRDESGKAFYWLAHSRQIINQ